MRVEATNLRLQCEEVLKAWGMNAEHARATSDRLAYADLHGIDSHGIALLPLYARLRTDGHLNFAADVRVVWDPPWTQSMISEEGKMKLGLI